MYAQPKSDNPLLDSLNRMGLAPTSLLVNSNQNPTDLFGDIAYENFNAPWEPLYFEKDRREAAVRGSEPVLTDYAVSSPIAALRPGSTYGGEEAMPAALKKNEGIPDEIFRTATRQSWSIIPGGKQAAQFWHFGLNAPKGQYEFYNQMGGSGDWGGSVGYHGSSSLPTYDSEKSKQIAAEVRSTPSPFGLQRNDVAAKMEANLPVSMTSDFASAWNSQEAQNNPEFRRFLQVTGPASGQVW